jgi:hypothetical protein
MLYNFNNCWVILFCIVLIIFIVKKIYNLNKSFDEKKFIQQYINQQQIKEKNNLNLISQSLPNIASYYVGINSFE